MRRDELTTLRRDDAVGLELCSFRRTEPGGGVVTMFTLRRDGGRPIPEHLGLTSPTDPVAWLRCFEQAVSWFHDNPGS